VSDSSRDKLISRRRRIWVSLFATIIGLFAFPSHAQAGPLLDWLFQRNQASAFNSGYSGSPYAASYGGSARNGTTAGYGAGYGGNYSANYDAASQLQQSAYGQGGYGQSGFGQLGQNNLGAGGGIFRGQNNSTLFPKCCLFGRGRQTGFASNNNPANNLAAANGLAGAAVDPRTTAGYGSCETGCQAGWCQQTVLRYVPQIAYRTAYQSVPVTTYKTSTTLNPANGLPRTCTRPCTTYSYQARRVPYTTYRPIYTTVPVADDCGGPNVPQQAGFAPQPYAAQNAQLSGFGAGPACTSCQNGGVPGYTPGNATMLPPGQLPPASQFSGQIPRGGQTGPWTPLSQSGSYGESYGDVSGATPWRPLRGSYGANTTGGSDSRIPWQRLDQNGAGGSSDADRRPTLRPYSNSSSYWQSNSYADDDYDSQSTGGSSTRFLPAEPMPRNSEETRSNLNQYDPNQRIDGVQANYRQPLPPLDYQERSNYVRPNYDSGSTNNRTFVDRGYENTYENKKRDYFDEEPMDRRMFTTPRQMSKSPYHNPLEMNETRRAPVDSYRSRAVRDLDRERRPRDDKTAQEESQPRGRDVPVRELVQNRNRGSRPMLDDEANATRSSRFASMPIDWSAVSRTRRVDTERSSSGWQVR